MKNCHSTHRMPYPTDLTDRQWELVKRIVIFQKNIVGTRRNVGGRPIEVDTREVVNAILYISKVKCPWRMLPHDFPHWQTVRKYYESWKKNKTLQEFFGALKKEFGVKISQLHI